MLLWEALGLVRQYGFLCSPSPGHRTILGLLYPCLCGFWSMISVGEIRAFYGSGHVFQVPSPWNLSRKHFRIETLNRRFVKLNRFENRVNANELRKFCVRYAPCHVYMSALDWLFPERVGKKRKANRAVPVGGEYVIDVDSYTLLRRHNHVHCSNTLKICYGCLETSKGMAVKACEKVERYYSDVAVVFSGRRGFHIHVLDFDLGDWTYYDERNPIKSHEVARLRLSRILALETYGFDRSHFILSVDPMRVLAVPGSLNAESGLRCLHIGGRRDLETLTVRAIVDRSKPFVWVYGHPEPAKAMKTLRCAKNTGEQH